jgi:hypothetical protein
MPKKHTIATIESSSIGVIEQHGVKSLHVQFPAWKSAGLRKIKCKDLTPDVPQTAVDTHRVSRLLNPPGSPPHAAADLGKKQVKRLLEGVSPVRLRKIQELHHLPDQIRLVLGERQLQRAQ